MTRQLLCIVGSLFVLVSLSAACKKSETVPVGGECSSRDDCQNRNDCLKVASGKGYCTKSCTPVMKDCPAGTTCQKVDMTITQGSNSVSAAGISRCLP